MGLWPPPGSPLAGSLRLIRQPASRPAPSLTRRPLLRELTRRREKPPPIPRRCCAASLVKKLIKGPQQQGSPWASGQSPVPCKENQQINRKKQTRKTPHLHSLGKRPGNAGETQHRGMDWQTVLINQETPNQATLRETINVNLCFFKIPPTAFQSTFKIRWCEELRILISHQGKAGQILSHKPLTPLMYVSPLFHEYFNGISSQKLGSSLNKNMRSCDSEKEKQNVSHR